MPEALKPEEVQDIGVLQSNAIKNAVLASIKDYNQNLPFDKKIGYKLEEKPYGFMLRLPDEKSTEEISKRLEEYGITYERLEGANVIRVFVSKEAAANLAKNAEKFRNNHPELYAALQRVSEIIERS